MSLPPQCSCSSDTLFVHPLYSSQTPALFRLVSQAASYMDWPYTPSPDLPTALPSPRGKGQGGAVRACGAPWLLFLLLAAANLVQALTWVGFLHMAGPGWRQLSRAFRRYVAMKGQLLWRERNASLSAGMKN